MNEFGLPTPSLSDAINEVRAQGGLIHDLPPVATQELATNHGLYTTVEARDPGNFIEFRRTLEREEAFASIAKKVGGILHRTKQYHDAIQEGVLGERLAGIFGSITHIECDDVYVADADPLPDGQKGIVTATETRLTVPTAEHANELSVALQGLLSTGSPEVFYPVGMYGKGNDSHVVKVGQLDEHAARSLSRSVEAVVAGEDRRRGVTLPPDKRTYQNWRASGETFPPSVEKRLRDAAVGYQQLVIAGSYRGRSDLSPRPKPRIIGNDAAAFFEGVRDILNGLIHDIRGGSHLNLEQHPHEAARPLVEAGIDLRRDKATLQQVQYGPLSGRPATLAEQSIDEGTKRLADARKHPYRTLAKGASGALSLPASVLGIAGAAVKYLPEGGAAGGHLITIYGEWRRRQQLAAAGGERLDRIASRQRRIQNGLGDWE